MRGARINQLERPINPSFLSCEKDAESIVRKLFVESKPYSDELKRLMLINTKDCLIDRTNPAYLNKIKSMSVAELRRNQYVRLSPKLSLEENEEVKSYLVITFDDFSPNAENPHYRDCTIEIDILCHTNYWELEGFAVRPLKIAGFIDGILNETRLSGIGTLNFIGCKEIVLSEDVSGYCLMYRAIHGVDDFIEGE